MTVEYVVKELQVVFMLDGLKDSGKEPTDVGAA